VINTNLPPIFSGPRGGVAA